MAYEDRHGKTLRVFDTLGHVGIVCKAGSRNMVLSFTPAVAKDIAVKLATWANRVEEMREPINRFQERCHNRLVLEHEELRTRHGKLLAAAKNVTDRVDPNGACHVSMIELIRAVESESS